MPEICSISAVTLGTSDMARAVRFYEALGFSLSYGGETSVFTSFRVGRPDAGGAASGRIVGRALLSPDRPRRPRPVVRPALRAWEKLRRTRMRHGSLTTFLVWS